MDTSAADTSRQVKPVSPKPSFWKRLKLAYGLVAYPSVETFASKTIFVSLVGLRIAIFLGIVSSFLYVLITDAKLLLLIGAAMLFSAVVYCASHVIKEIFRMFRQL